MPALNVAPPMISRMSIFILSYFLVQSGVRQPTSELLALTSVVAGTIGFLAYLAFEWTESRRLPARSGR